MQIINNFSISVCVVAILSSLFEFITPSGNMKKIMQFIIAMFVIFSVALPFLNLVNNFNLNMLNISKSEENMENNLDINNIYTKTSQEKLNKLIEKTLKENEITAENIETNMDINESGSIDINKIIIYLKKEDKNKALKTEDIIKKDLGLNCEIKILGE